MKVVRSDRDQLKDMLTRAGIEFEEDLERFTLTVEKGYSGFVTVFQFTEDEDLKDMGAYE